MEKNHNSVSVNYGPLTFSLNIKERYVEKSSVKTGLMVQDGRIV